MIYKKMNLQLFADYGIDFFKNAFNEEYSVDEVEETGNNIDVQGASEGVGATESDSNDEVDQMVDEVDETPTEPTTQPPVQPQLTQEELIEAFRKAQEPVVDEKTQQAIELMEFLEQNPQLIEAMRTVDASAHQTLNNFIPDEVSKKLQELEEFKIEQEYQAIVRDMKTKYPDFDEEKVLETVEKYGLNDLEIGYKIYKSENAPTFDVEAERKKLREEMKAEIMRELKNDISNTSSIIGQGDVPPAKQEVVLSQQERRVAENLGMSVEEYAKWRDNI